MTPKEFLTYPISHIMLYEDFRQEVHTALFKGPGKTDDRLADLDQHVLSVNQIRRLEVIAQLFEGGYYLKGCKRLRVI